jgi:hypothetical protein
MCLLLVPNGLGLQTSRLSKSPLALGTGKAKAHGAIVENDGICYPQPLRKKGRKGEKTLIEGGIIGDIVVEDEEVRGVYLHPLIEIFSPLRDWSHRHHHPCRKGSASNAFILWDYNHPVNVGAFKAKKNTKTPRINRAWKVGPHPHEKGGA